MKYKLIAVDMDGTLLRRDGSVSEATVEAIETAKQNGLLFTVSTGRPIMGVEAFLPLVSQTVPMITYNGAVVVRPDTRQILFAKTLTASDAEKILRQSVAWGTIACFWSHDRLYYNTHNERVRSYCEISGAEPILCLDFAGLAAQGITKVIFIDAPERLKTFQQEVGDLSLDEVTCCTSRPDILEFFNSNVSKASALQQIAQLCGIDREEIVAVGDGQNDIDMIRYAGLGVAMANAHPDVLRAADEITASNEEDGVARLLLKLLR